MSRVKVINFGETLSIYGAVDITPQTSGILIGSSIWIIKINQKKIVYLNDFSDLQTHCGTSILDYTRLY